jgi:4-amino-4-deoxy-L-arabinose transferase-like glycosyltransferase
MINNQSNRPLLFFLVLAGVLFLPAYLINLNLVQLIRDEAIRAIVAFEMIQRGDYITPDHRRGALPHETAVIQLDPCLFLPGNGKLV